MITRHTQPSPVLTLQQLSDVITQQHNAGEIIVLCHGVFDLLHPGHIEHLVEAKSHGDVLLVTVTPDRYVNKGPGRPVFSETHRAAMLNALAIVDFVAITESPTAIDAIKLLKPNVYVKGPDYVDASTDVSGNIAREHEAVASVGGRIQFTEAPTMSSSKIINSIEATKSGHLANWLSAFRKEHAEADVMNSLKELAELKVLVIGEAIIDEYVLCEALGKSSKDPVLAFRELSYERQIGGSLAIAAHCAGLGAQVTALFYISDNGLDEEFIRSRVSGSMSLEFVKSKSMPTITKRRYVDSLTESRVFETYIMNDEPVSKIDESGLRDKLKTLLPTTDIVLVADYGHGMLSESVIQDLAKSSNLLAVNTQSNAGNRGYNTISRYPRVDFVCLNGSEMGLELRRRHLSVAELVPQLRNRTGAQRVIVTEGARGLVCCDETGTVVQVPAFAQVVKDRVGAGDALFAVTALLFATKSPSDITGLFGNLAGAALVGELGNRSHISAANLMRHASALLK
jgi:rfaE bifunctional protein nucleotidyltransferase chain/domain